MKYIDAELLRKEIEKSLKDIRDYMTCVGMNKSPKYYRAQGKESAYDALLNIIDSLQQEQPDKSLEEEIETWIPAHISVRTDKTLPLNPTELADVCKEWGKCIARHFAEWQKSQMMKDAYVESQIVEDGRIDLEGDPLPCLNPIILLPYPQFKPGDKVKVIVLKDNEDESK